MLSMLLKNKNKLKICIVAIRKNLQVWPKILNKLSEYQIYQIITEIFPKKII
jgi:hypothetical protein